VLLDALNRQRGKGQQKVTVEHVHVAPGGQVVVGVVEAPGGGVQPKSEDQPHASEIANDLGIWLAMASIVGGLRLAYAQQEQRSMLMFSLRQRASAE
jgi:hypothetical protein